MSLKGVCCALVLCLGLASAEPLTLRQAGEESLRNHPDLAIAESALKVQEGRLKQRQAPFFPVLLGTTGVRRNQASVDNDLNASVDLRQTLADFGKRRNRSRQQEWEAQANRAAVDDTAQSLLTRVADAYLALNRDQQLMKIQEQNVRWSCIRLKEADSRGLDRTLAQSDLSAANLALLNASNVRKISQVNLGNAMGRDVAYEGETAAAFFEAPEWGDGDALKLALIDRPDLKAASARVSAADSGLKAARADFLPTVNAVGRYGFIDLGLPQQFNQWNAGVTMTFPIVNYHQLSGSVDEAKAEAERRDAVNRSLELAVSGQVNASVVNVEQTRLQVRQNQRNVMTAYYTFIETWAAYRLGRGNSRDLSNAQRDLVASQTALASTAFSHQRALLQLYRDTGQLTLEVLPDESTAFSTSINRYLAPRRLELPTSNP